MKVFASSVPAPQPKNRTVLFVSLFYAVIIVAMLVAQLFSYEDFLQVLALYDLPGGTKSAYIIAAAVVSAELLALPFLLRMALSPAFRVVSAASGVVVALFWLFASVWTLTYTPEVATVGFFGSVIDSAPSTASVVVGVAFTILSVVSCWGLYNRQVHHKK